MNKRSFARLGVEHHEGYTLITGEGVFFLHDTAGFPVDALVDYIKDHNERHYDKATDTYGRFMTADIKGFHRLMFEQKARSRANSKF